MKTCWGSRKKMTVIYRIVNFFIWLFFHIFYRVKVYGLEHFYEGSGIIAANHCSYFDPPLLGTLWPEDVHYLAREPLFKNKLFGWVIRKLNAHPLKGHVGDVGVFKTILELLSEGKKVILFPEGKRSSDNNFSPIRPGIGLLVTKSGSSIIPAYIFGTFDAWPRFRKIPRLWKTLGCVFGSPIKSEDYKDKDRKAAQRDISEKLMNSLMQLKSWYESGAKGSPP